MDQILILPADQRAAALLVPALSPSFRVKAVAEFPELESALIADDPLVCILDIFHPPPPIPLDTIRQLRRRHPAVALVVATDFSGREIDLYHLGRMSVDGVIRIETEPSAREIRSIVDRAISSALATRVTQSLVGTFPARVRDALRWAIEHAETKPQVSEMAAALGTSHRSLAREMQQLEVAPPRTLLLWGRLVRASYLLERPSETVESAAYRLGYATGGALGKALRRHTGHSPTGLLQAGGLARTLEILRHRGIQSNRHGR